MMPLRIPPRPPTEVEYAARRAAGAQTWRELDPELATWVDDAERTQKVQAICIVLGAAGLIAVAIIIAGARLFV
jgi:hypothetical protein